MPFLNQKLFFLFDVPEPPSFIVRATSNMDTHRVEFNTVADVIVAFESYALLVFVVGV